MNTKRIAALLMPVSIAFSAVVCSGCGGTEEVYYEEIYSNPLEGADAGGYDTLTFAEEGDTVTLENENVRLILDRFTGGIRELVNKQSVLYLVRDSNGEPLTVLRRSGEHLTGYETFEYSKIKEDGRVGARLMWGFADGLSVRAEVSLSEHADELVFRLGYEGNDAADPVLCVEYPVICRIGTLYEGERDYLLHPFATGYLFRDPVGNFDGESFAGITREYGLYPSGWESPMQFYAYYSLGIGGFEVMTRDGGSTIKSFPVVADGDGLRASVWHYPDDPSQPSAEFGYDISVGNLTEGTWYEAAEKYRGWATEQSWATEKGKLSERTDIDRTFYEEVVACNFNFPYQLVYGEAEQRELYEKMRENAGGKMLNVFFADDDGVIDLSKEYGDYFVRFEFPDFHSVTTANQNPAEWKTAIRNADGGYAAYWLNGTQQFYECASCEDYLSRFAEKEQGWYDRYGVSGYYHDVGVAAVHPKQCYDSSHPHGTRVNIVPECLAQMALTKEIGQKNGANIYGQELIFEQMLPYLDFYQARGNAEELGFMENDRIRPLIEGGVCEKVCLFDYVYGAYGAKRLDGYLYADELLGESYYHIAAYTALNGGIPEYNYEFVHNGEYLQPQEHSAEMMSFLGALARVKQTYGKNYLVYGEMVRPPETGAGENEYDYIQQRFLDGTDGGVAVFDRTVTSAFRYENKIGIFVCNPTKDAQTLRFIVNALRDYGISDAKVTLTDGEGVKSFESVKDGKLRVALDLGPREIVMLELEVEA